MNGIIRTFLGLSILLSTLYPAIADTRSEPIDVYVLVDVSLSMKDKIETVTSYINANLVDAVLIPGDSFTIVTFYGKARKSFDREIRTNADIRAAHAFLAGLKADGQYTDIGNALDVLQATIAAKKDSGHKKYIQMFTDGIQEAPPRSRYPITGDVLRHPFMQYEKTIDHGTWKEITIGFGVAEKADAAVNALMATVQEPPRRNGQDAAADGNAKDAGKKPVPLFRDMIDWLPWTALAAILVIIGSLTAVILISAKRKRDAAREEPR
jgi:hypothetical protein